MADPRAMVRVLDEVLWVLRREGLDISTAQAIDAARAVAAVGFARREDVREALAAVVVTRARDRPRFDRAFDAFFSADAAGARDGTLWERLAVQGFEQGELDALRALLQSFEGGGGAPCGASIGGLLERGADFDRALVLGGLARDFDATSEPRFGFLSHRLLSRAGFAAAGKDLAALRRLLVGALGPRGEALADALARELEAAQVDARSLARRHVQMERDDQDRQSAGRRTATTPFVSLGEQELEEVRRSVRRFAERLRSAARLRVRRRARHGRIDPHKTLGRAFRTGGVPFEVVRKRRRRERPKLVLLCDISDSVRAAARFLLELAYVAQELFERTRSFVFVSDLGETTQLFAREPVGAAVARAWSGEIVSTSDNSNYGRALRAFEDRFARDLDRRTTVVILGDGRTNYHQPAADVVGRMRERCRALVWLCPEPRSEWGQGDSAMAVYAPQCTAVYEVACAADLERAARVLVARG
jgi:uncharacterized protein with von Willebrand factor type A (vWA) domain